MKKKYLCYGLMIILIMCASGLLVSCSVGGGEDEETTPEEGVEIVAAAFISLETSQVSVQSDNSDNATITATVLDENHALIQGLTVSFSADGGQINASSVDTDENGQAQISFSSGTVQTTQTVTITAEVPGLAPATIPIQIRGTTVVLSTDNTNITIGDPPVDLTVHVQDFSSGGLPDVPVTLSVAPADVVTLSQDTGNTDINGELVVQVTGIAAGSVTVTAEALAITDTLTYTVGAAGTVFGISSPTDPWNLDTNTDLTVTVDAPGITNVIFATTLGAWDGGVELVVTKPVVAGSASAVLNSPTAGVATVQVFDANDPSTRDSLTVVISAPPIEASQISLQPSAKVVAPSFGDVSNTVTLEATVKNVLGQVVGDAPVAFSILNPTGGGESISPVIAFTGSNGVATSTFTSGTLSSGAEGVTVQAVVVGMPLVTDSVNIVIGGTAGSVMIGRSTKISSIAGDTAYSLPMSVLVADTNGNPVPGAVVSLSAWPAYYYTGYTVDGPVITGGPYANEDINRNLILDPGEDVGLDPGHGDGSLTPPNAAAGTLPATVTTDENGVASFDLVYLKSSAVWIDDEITASTIVYGTETTSTLKFGLPYLVSDKPYLPDSPYGYGDLSITVSAGANGTIDPPGPVVTVTFGSDQTFFITPDANYDVDDVQIDGISMGPMLVWSFFNLTENHTISATFIPIP